MDKKTFYVTTPIYYVNSEPHIGSAYTTIVADMITRYKRLSGYDVFFLTGTDEHGQKILETSQKAGVDVQIFCNKLAGKFQELWKDLDISNNDFIRTTEPRHAYVVQAFVKRLFDRGYIYKGIYEGWYCVHEEAFWTEEDLIRENGHRICPTCKREVRWVAEENYFFRLSAFQEPLRELYEKNPSFVEPDFRRNEMLNIIKSGLKDLSISRTSFSWGVPMPDDPKHVIYVWVDALINYISALGYDTDDPGLYQKYWPADLHLIAKEINRFHSIIWPAMLMAADLPLPRKVFAHGWLTVNGEKISKSAGNAIDPRLLMEAYGKDAVKYYLLRDINFGKDGDFSEDHLIQRINADLANDLGNLLHRTAAMSHQNFGGTLNRNPDSMGEAEDAELKAAFETMKATYFDKMDKYQFTQALEALWTFIGFANKYIDMTEPWKLAKDEQKKGRLNRVLWNLAEALRNIAVAIKPIMFETSQRIYERLGFGLERWEKATFEYFLWDNHDDFQMREGDPLFPRIDIKLLNKVIHMTGVDTKNAAEKAPLEKQAPAAVEEKPENVLFISYDQFKLVQMKVGLVLEARKIEKSRKLMHLSVDLGEPLPRQIIAGIAQFYEAEALAGKRIIVIANLEPAKLMGMESFGMLLAAKDGVNMRLLTVDGEIQPGAAIS